MREATTKADRDFVFSKLHYYEKHPKKSQRFMDIFPIFTSSRAMEIVINDLVNYIRDNYDVQKDIAAIVGPEAEKFILGPLVAGAIGTAIRACKEEREVTWKYYPREIQQMEGRRCIRDASSCVRRIR